MPGFIKRYVEIVDRMNYFVGRATMLLIFLMIGILFYSSVSKTFFHPALWTLEFAQFLMSAYFLLGGAYSLQQKSHVRMDLLYSQGSKRTQHRWDTFTSIFMIAFLLMLLYGSISSLTYAFEYGELLVVATLYVAGEARYGDWHRPNVTSGDRRIFQRSGSG